MSNRKRRIQEVAFVAIVVAIAAGAIIGLNQPESAFRAPSELPACLTEDSDNCYWDAPNTGNGEGKSFYIIDGFITYEDGTTYQVEGE